MFFRNMLADLGFRSAYSVEDGNFTPYFQYRIGPYQRDHYLYFPKEPYPLRYKNEIFNKLVEYKGYDSINYLEFHYTAYKDKGDFLRFMRYELSERLKRKPRNAHRPILQAALEWTAEKAQEIRSEQEIRIRQEIEPEVWQIIKSRQLGTTEDIDKEVKEVAGKLAERINELMTGAEETMEALTGSFLTGNIEVNNHNHLDKVIQALTLLRMVQAPLKVARAEQLFKRFSATDLASLLHLHFTAFKDKKLNTAQVRIKECEESLNRNNPKTQKLMEALQDFFY